MATGNASAPKLWIGWLLVLITVGLGLLAWRRQTYVAPSVPPTEIAPTSSVAVGEPAVTAPAQAPPEDPESVRAAHLQRLQAHAQRQGDRAASRQQYWIDGFAAQKVEPQWAATHEHDILQMTRSGDFAAVEDKPVGLKIECRTSVCRIDAGFSSPNAAQDWIELVTLHSQGRFAGGATNITNLEDGTASVRIFVSPQP